VGNGLVFSAFVYIVLLSATFTSSSDEIEIISKFSLEVLLPDEILRKYLDEEEIQRFKEKEIGIFSITVSAEK
jgi:hypothetical protein